MAAVCGVRDWVDAWIDDPDLVQAEFEALIAENFAAEPPGTEDGPASPPDRSGPEPRARRRSLRREPVRTAPAGRRVARERGPPSRACPRRRRRE